MRTTLGGWSSLGATPILGVNLWLDRPVLREPLVGLLGTEIHWVFNKTELWRNAAAIADMNTQV